jgi:predicted nucleic acid-binding protein
MIHLDASLLVALIKKSDVHHATAGRAIAGPGPFGCSSIAWMELHSKPVHPRDTAALKALLNAGISPLDEASAALAGEIYHRTGSNRRTRLDTIIAATAILTGAELATVNAGDFEPFVPHGLKLHPLKLPAR